MDDQSILIFTVFLIKAVYVYILSYWRERTQNNLYAFDKTIDYNIEYRH